MSPPKDRMVWNAICVWDKSDPQNADMIRDVKNGKKCWVTNRSWGPTGTGSQSTRRDEFWVNSGMPQNLCSDTMKLYT